ncbi:hypothetical protein ACIRSS_32225 [Amycolatopsis sp. NPDC101161]|uniref:hypothetical protein n=1 Tax=Amycolatopsis sp. NPDC101161 TaxID=3363940 RepID=UPI0037FEE817
MSDYLPEAGDRSPPRGPTPRGCCGSTTSPATRQLAAESVAPAEKPGKQEVAPRLLPPGAVGFAPSVDSVNTARANLVKRPEERKKPPAVWVTFPEADRRELLEMWKEWQAGKADTDVPPTGDYIAAKGLLGSTTRCPGSSGSSSPTTRGP